MIKMLLRWHFPLCLSILIIIIMVDFQLGLCYSGINHTTLFPEHVKFYRYQKPPPYRVIYVDQSGHGHFSRIQAAIDSIPSNNNQWICIYVKAGIYREKVVIPVEKPYIILKGEGKRKTHIVWGDHEFTAQSPTFTSNADNFIARSISFVNSYNLPLNNGNPRLPAVAAMINGDKSAFYRCGFAGVQDTLWDERGRHYFKRCTIQGSVDFIFGSGQSIYENCTIHALEPGYITAQGRDNPRDQSGFVFKGCRVFGKGPTFLGRSWRGFSRVVFYNSYLDSIIDPLGWNSWNYGGYENQITFVEYGNYGPGADTSNRVRWVSKLSLPSLEVLISMSFINVPNWIDGQPF